MLRIDDLLWPPQRHGLEVHSNTEVSLAEFAAIGGLTEAEYSKRMFERLECGDLMGLLGIEAQCDLGDWISGRFLGGKREFLVVFRLSLNRIRDVALFCVCSMDMSGDEAAIRVRHAIPGQIGSPPAEAFGLEPYEMSFCDMEAGI